MWEQIERNKRWSVVVITAMGCILIGIGMALGMYLTGQEQGALIGGIVALGIWFVMWITTKSSGDDIMLQMAGAREIKKADHPQLFNVVEEMTIASQLSKMPRVFIVDDPAPNAFAVGKNPDKAAVAVTIGLLRLMNRDELQGVIAHEIGHIKNRDVALMTTAGIMIGAIVLLGEIGMRMVWFGGGARRSRDDSGGGGAQAIMMIVAILFLILSPILAQMIYFALSRRREYLADASGAMYTRWPEGLASALEKLGGSHTPQADQSRVTAPMYINRPLSKGEHRSLSSTFSTHPPLKDRIKVLRSMGNSADFASYDRAFSQMTGKHVVGSQTLSQSDEVTAHRPDTSSDPTSSDPMTPNQRLRSASNAYLAGAGYQRRDCPSCGVTLKIPQARQGRPMNCPRCGTKL